MDKRREKNRLSAARSRKRKANYIAKLEEENFDLKKENIDLQKEIDSKSKQFAKLMDLIHNLEAQVVELFVENDIINNST